MQTSPITRGTLNTEQTFIGSIHFTQSSLLASKTQGLVLAVNFDATQEIHKGDTLVELDHEILDSTIKALQASIKELKLLTEKSAKDLKRYKILVKQKNVSQQKYDEIYYDKIRIDQKFISSNAELQALLIERKQNMITAPFSGIITERHVEIGEWVDKGGKIATLVNPKKMYALFDLPASYALNIHPGKTLILSIGKETINGTIEGIILKGDNKSRTFPLRIKLDLKSSKYPSNSTDTFFSGMEALIKLPRSQNHEMLLVPRDAVIKRFGHDVIFIVQTKEQQDSAKMVAITVSLFDGSMAAIQASDENEQLVAGMQVIVKGNERVFPGQALKIQNLNQAQ
ncbi:efflux RND transporter periplasmic adaptor subunit [sulfur-oxidizing endosymbiont of Gigantopelta aegis]|uniref:efflux RND transporter periplasmic adaptor subunit n=1 Tax=sulfur-oxidizing endosymbiont of Gigantopelta aegis TaxID=2794934 RepID=UPI001BE49CB0|nr:efflux RND transporter periplasmic adaptor subunit [sulfur-oxidizing endosymbiont of Gigantopelta aegis]